MMNIYKQNKYKQIENEFHACCSARMLVAIANELAELNQSLKKNPRG